LKIKASLALLFLFLSLSFTGVKNHPVYVSVTEIEFNPADKSLEIICRVFTNDFEATLKKETPGSKIDLLASDQKKKMEQIVAAYLFKHLKIAVDGKWRQMEWVGYEQQEESIASYLQVTGVEGFKKITVKDDILYEYKKEQISLIHLTVKGKRKSTKLNNPDSVASFEY
jgi:hypothetical protein